MIQTPLVMNRALPKHGDRQWMLESLLKKALDYSCLRQEPVAGTGVANERSSPDHTALRNRAHFGQLLFRLDLNEHLRDLSIRAADLLLNSADFELSFAQRLFRLLD